MANSSVEIELVALVEEATKTLKKFRKETQTELNSINFNTGATAIVSGFNLIKDAAQSAFGLISDFAGKAIQESINAEKANNELANALRLSGDYSQDAVNNFDALAKSLASVSTFSDDAIKSSIALAKTYNATNKEAADIVKVSADLASILGISLDEATRKVAQTLSGNVDRSLAKIIPSLKSLSKESLVAGDAIAVIGNKVQGSASILGNTFAGALFRAQESSNDFLESIGDLVTKNDAIIAGINLVSKAFNDLQIEFEKNKTSISAIVTDGFIFLIQSLPAVIKFIQLLDKAISTTTVAFYTLGRSIGAIGAALVELASLNFDGIKEINKAVSEENAAAFEQNAKRISDFYSPLIKTTESLAGNISKVANESKKAAKEFKNIGTKEARKVEKTPEEIKAEIEKQRKLIEETSKEPIQNIIKVAFDAQAKGMDTKQLAAAGAGLVNQILKGAEGAKGAVTGILGGIADAIVPGIGGVVSEIAGVLAQGPEKTKEMVQGFVKAVPEFIKGLVASIPTLITELVKAIPQLGMALAAQAPFIAIELVTNIIKNIPAMVKGFAEEFLKIPALFVDQLLGLIGLGGDSGFLGLFASGGRVPDVPKYQGDKFPARLSAGEQVLSKDLSTKLESFLSGGGTSGQPMVVNVVVGQQQLARAIFDLNRGGFRTA